MLTTHQQRSIRLYREARKEFDMPLLQTLGQGQGFLKAGFLGFQKSGKTFTSTLLAIAVREMFSLKGPIAMFDTETGSEYVAPVIRNETGLDLVGLRSRSFDQLVEMGKECEGAGVSVLIVDSVTHVWRELGEAFLRNINEARRRKNLAPRHRLEFQDWGRIKSRWSAWTDLYLNSKLHIIVCGRAGYEYDFEKDDEGRKELVKTGIKMKTEGEFGFEPSLLVEMEQVQDISGEHTKVYRQATIIGDRFSVLDGHVGTFDPVNADKPKEVKAALARVATFFGPHLQKLIPGAISAVDTASRSDLGADENGDDDWRRERRERTILCEEIQGELTRVYPGQGAKDKAAKLELLEMAFSTRSWTRIEEKLNSTELRAGLALIRERVALLAPPLPNLGSTTDETQDATF